MFSNCIEDNKYHRKPPSISGPGLIYWLPGLLFIDVSLSTYSYLKPSAGLTTAVLSGTMPRPLKDIKDVEAALLLYFASALKCFRVCGIRSHFTEAVSHQSVLNEICLCFSILLTVIILVNTRAFNKGAWPLPDSNNKSN